MIFLLSNRARGYHSWGFVRSVCISSFLYLSKSSCRLMINSARAGATVAATFSNCSVTAWNSCRGIGHSTSPNSDSIRLMCLFILAASDLILSRVFFRLFISFLPFLDSDTSARRDRDCDNSSSIISNSLKYVPSPEYVSAGFSDSNESTSALSSCNFCS